MRLLPSPLRRALTASLTGLIAWSAPLAPALAAPPADQPIATSPSGRNGSEGPRSAAAEAVGALEAAPEASAEAGAGPSDTADGPMGVSIPRGGRSPMGTSGDAPSTQARLQRESLVRARFGAAAGVQLAAAGPGPELVSVRSLTGLSVPTRGADLRERAARFLGENLDLFGLDPARAGVLATEHKTLAMRALPPSADGAGAPSPASGLPRHIVRLRQTHLGLPVEGRDVVVILDAEHRVTRVQSDLMPLEVPTPTRTLSGDEAVRVVKATFVIADTGRPQRVILANGTAGRIAWRVPVALTPLSGHHTVWVDAEDGRILREARVGHDHGLVELPRQPAAEETE